MLGKRYDQPSNMGDKTLMPGNAHISTSTKEMSSFIRCDKTPKSKIERKLFSNWTENRGILAHTQQLLFQATSCNPQRTNMKKLCNFKFDVVDTTFAKCTVNLYNDYTNVNGQRDE